MELHCALHMHYIVLTTYWLQFNRLSSLTGLEKVTSDSCPLSLPPFATLTSLACASVGCSCASYSFSMSHTTPSSRSSLLAS